MVFPIVGGDGKPTGYDVTNSVRYDDGDSPQLSRSMSSGNQQVFTLATWLKRGNVGTGNQRIFSSDDEASADFRLRFNSSDTLEFTDSYTGNSSTYTEVYTVGKFRDVSAWYHIVVAVDTTQGTASNRVKIYINGVQETNLDNGSGGSTKYPSQNDNLGFGRNGKTLEVGASLYSSSPRQSFDGYLAETYVVDGAQLTPNYFGEFDDNGVWIPVEPDTGAGGSITYGTNGFLLQYKQTGTSANSSGIGADTSGQDNHLTPTNLAAIDITTDTPTNNFATLNSRDDGKGSATLAQGNLNFGGHDGGTARIRATQGVTTGKWYAEFRVASNHKLRISITDDIGMTTSNTRIVNDGVDFGINDGYLYTYLLGTGNDTGAGSSSSGVNLSYTHSSNDIIGVALDADNNTVRFYVNGSAQGSEATVLQRSTTANAIHFFSMYDFSGSGNNANSVECNFGQPTFSISSGNADGAGHGNFEYAPPSGFLALCTKNLGSS